jgi:hypothetical protein
MKPQSSIITFETSVGKVDIISIHGGWVFEFRSGYNNGLHCQDPFKTFDKCYSYIKGRIKGWEKEQKIDDELSNQ